MKPTPKGAAVTATTPQTEPQPVAGIRNLVTGGAPSNLSRRQFLGSTLAATAAGSLIGAIGSHAAEEKPAAPPSEIKRKIKLGVVGNGGRGSWIAGLFKEHGGYEMHAVADYFPQVADRCGDALGVDKSRRFSGLSGYKKLIESGVEAVAIEDVPYFYPEQAKAVVESGCHVYMAKPIAVDVPGCLAIEALGKLATQKKLCFLVDYQMPTDPLNIEIASRIWDGGMGKILAVMTNGAGGATSMRDDPPKGKTIEGRLQSGIWGNDIALGGDIIVNFDIHPIDAAIWVIRQRPVSAVGHAEIYRPNPQSDCHDLWFVIYDFADGLRWNHQSLTIPNHGPGLLCNISGQSASAQLNYFGKSFLRGGPKHFGGGEVESLYDRGAKRNIATFYQNITEGHFENPTVGRAADGTLTAILGREAGARHARLTMDELIKENRLLEVDLTGLKT